MLRPSSLIAYTLWSVRREHFASDTFRKRGACDTIARTASSVSIVQQVKSSIRKCSHTRKGGDKGSALRIDGVGNAKSVRALQ